MGEAQRRRNQGVVSNDRSVVFSGIELFVLLKLLNLVGVKGDLRQRADLLDQLIAEEDEWDWDKSLGKQPFSEDRFYIPVERMLTRASLDYVQEFIDRVAKGESGSNGETTSLVSGSASRYLNTIYRKCREAANAPAPVKAALVTGQ